MKTLLSILAATFVVTTAQAQERADRKQVADESAKTATAKKENKEAAKEAEVKKEELDINFRGHEQRVRHSIYTLGGRLTPPGRKPGEGC